MTDMCLERRLLQKGTACSSDMEDWLDSRRGPWPHACSCRMNTSNLHRFLAAWTRGPTGHKASTPELRVRTPRPPVVVPAAVTIIRIERGRGLPVGQLPYCCPAAHHPMCGLTLQPARGGGRWNPYRWSETRAATPVWVLGDDRWRMNVCVAEYGGDCWRLKLAKASVESEEGDLVKVRLRRLAVNQHPDVGESMYGEGSFSSLDRPCHDHVRSQTFQLLLGVRRPAAASTGLPLELRAPALHHLRGRQLRHRHRIAHVQGNHLDAATWT